MNISPHARDSDRRRARVMKTPDTSHLSPEDAELLTALYLERNAVSRGELARVRYDIGVSREAERQQRGAA